MLTRRYHSVSFVLTSYIIYTSSAVHRVLHTVFSANHAHPPSLWLCGPQWHWSHTRTGQQPNAADILQARLYQHFKSEWGRQWTHYRSRHTQAGWLCVCQDNTTQQYQTLGPTALWRRQARPALAQSQSFIYTQQYLLGWSHKDTLLFLMSRCCVVGRQQRQQQQASTRHQMSEEVYTSSLTC